MAWLCREGDRSMFSDSVFAVKMHPLAEKWTSPRPPRERLPHGIVRQREHLRKRCRVAGLTRHVAFRDTRAGEICVDLGSPAVGRRRWKTARRSSGDREQRPVA